MTPVERAEAKARCEAARERRERIREALQGPLIGTVPSRELQRWVGVGISEQRLQAGKCEASSDGIMPGTLLVCDLLAGHNGMHHDPMGADWTAGQPEGTIEYAVQCSDGGFKRHYSTPTTYDDLPTVSHIATICDKWGLRGRCGPHRVVQHSVGPWLPVPEGTDE